jgi:hypothetical protein
MREGFDHHHEAGDDWPFEEPPNAVVFINNSVIEDPTKVRGIVRSLEGDWEVHDGVSYTADSISIACLACTVERHHILTHFSDLELGGSAWLSDDDETWNRFSPSRRERFMGNAWERLRRLWPKSSD